MNEPSVCAVMLTANRPEMARQAVECFRRQTYENKWLLIWDSGQDLEWYGEDETPREAHIYADRQVITPRTIGELRNEAVGFWTEYPIIVHFDDDDYSYPNRIAEQVALLQSSVADCVGYNSMLFWREPNRYLVDQSLGGEAWLYSQPNPSYALGTSLCYWRKTWERRPFEATSVGEDVRFTSGLKVAAVSSITQGEAALMAMKHKIKSEGVDVIDQHTPEPRMVARIHPGNTSNAYRPEAMARASEWKRVPEWDSYCRSVFAKNEPYRRDTND